VFTGSAGAFTDSAGFRAVSAFDGAPEHAPTTTATPNRPALDAATRIEI
jgi:hypothetical protein